MTHPISSADIQSCRHPKRKFLYPIIMLVSLSIAIAALYFSYEKDMALNYLRDQAVTAIVGEGTDISTFSEEEKTKMVHDEFDKDSGNTSVLIYETADLLLHPIAIIIAVYIFLMVLFYPMYTKVRASGVRISPDQFPKAYALYEDMAKKLGFKKIPELYLINGNGVYNAFASCVPGYRNYAVIHSEVFCAYEKGGDEQSFRFIMGHELGHIRLNHTAWWNVLALIWTNFPFVNKILGLPFSRLQEYEADQIGKLLVPEEQGTSFMMLGVGREVYQSVDLHKHCEHHKHHGGIGNIIANFGASHPILPWRMRALQEKKHGGLIFPTK